jgi:outer membrane protein assembly factor BamB
VRFNKENSIPKGRWNSELIVCLDRASGRQLWSREAEHRYNTASLAVAQGKVFCIDSHSPEEIGAMKRRGIEVGKLPSALLALDARTGTEVWKKVSTQQPAVMDSLHFMSLRTRDDWLEYSSDHDLLIAGKGDFTYAVNASTGEDVWQAPRRGNQPLILGPDTFISQTGHTYDTKTGKLLNGSALFRRGGCNYAVGNINLLFLRSNCAAYVDVKSGKQFNLRSLRSGCSNSLVAADGLLNVPCFSVGCVCNYPIQTSFAMRHMPETADWHGHTPIKLELPVTPDKK